MFDSFKSLFGTRKTPEELIALCEEFWRQLSTPHADDPGVSYSHYVEALNELSKDAPASLDWARRCLVSNEYEERAAGAFLAGAAMQQQEYAEEERAELAAELRVVALRPIDYDPKELEANDAAVDALGAARHPAALAALREILGRPDTEENTDLRFNAAGVVGDWYAGEDFREAEDPAGTAIQWIDTRDTTG